MVEEASTREVEDLFLERLFTGPLVKIHHYHCLVRSSGLSKEKLHQWHTIVMPLTGHFSLHFQDGPVMVEPNTFLYENPGAYRSSHPCGIGDAGTWLVVPTDLLIDTLAPYDPAVVDRPGRLFVFPVAPSSPREFMLARLLLFQLARQEDLDALTIDETALHLVTSAVTAPYRLRGMTPTGVGIVPSARRERVEAVKEVLFERHGERLRLAEIALAVGASPFGLCRAFRRVTGLSIHQYLNRLRLRAAVDLMSTSTTLLVDIASQVGFCSHAHFTKAFRAEFGLAPRDFRRTSLGGVAWKTAWALVTRDPSAWPSAAEHPDLREGNAGGIPHGEPFPEPLPGPKGHVREGAGEPPRKARP
jgi:AraC-like DNA-binding protein